MDDLIAGKIGPARMSEPIPEENEGPVYIVVGDSWDDIAQDTTKDVMIAQVAELSGPCYRLKPVYAMVAAELKKAGVEHVKFATMEATENGAPHEYKARGFPSIYLFKVGEKQKGINFSGDLTSKGIIEWVQVHTSIKFEFDTSTLGEDPEPEEAEDEFDKDDYGSDDWEDDDF